MTRTRLRIRPAVAADAAAIASIDNEAIRSTTATFDTVPKSAPERLQWLDTHDERHPVFAAELDNPSNMDSRKRSTMFTLDIGGEGRHHEAWNLNPRRLKTLGPEKGMPIPRRICGRAEDIPLPRHSVDRIILERTPLRRQAVMEILRVIHPRGEIILRHAPCDGMDRHALARQLIPGRVDEQRVRIGTQWLQETHFRLSR